MLLLPTTSVEENSVNEIFRITRVLFVMLLGAARINTKALEAMGKFVPLKGKLIFWKSRETIRAVRSKP